MCCIKKADLAHDKRKVEKEMLTTLCKRAMEKQKGFDYIPCKI